jgi:cytochrome c553
VRAWAAWVLFVGLLPLLWATGPQLASATEPLSEQTLSRVWAITPDADHGKILYLMHCSACHGKHPWGDGPRAIPALAGQREKYLVVQLTLFAIGKREGQSMHETMQRSDLDWAQAVRDLGAYLSGAPRSPAPEYGESNDTSAGKRVYQKTCSDCHGIRGEGKETGLPAIGGQQYNYLVTQLDNFSHGHRGAGDLQLLESMGGLTPQAVQDVANYASHLTYLTADDNPR